MAVTTNIDTWHSTHNVARRIGHHNRRKTAFGVRISLGILTSAREQSKQSRSVAHCLNGPLTARTTQCNDKPNESNLISASHFRGGQGLGARGLGGAAGRERHTPTARKKAQ
jgi:hypothetical protein